MTKNSIGNEIEAVIRVIGLPICYHDRLGISGLPKSLAIHCHLSCLKIKRYSDKKCSDYDAGFIHERLANHPEGEIHQCPFGLTEIAVPVLLRDAYAGVLFAGPCCFDNGDSAILVPDMRWLEDRQVILQALAVKIAFALEAIQGKQDDRKSMILNMIYKKMNSGIQLADAADVLHLSPSRTGHLVKELFDETFPQLVNRIKMREAARMLSAGEKSIFEIAESFGFSDQNYFSRAFRSVHTLSPREYRKQIQIQA